ncbi:PREDICTED: solute carrier family 28 member 3-like isoform X2 [Priapulus caudatus]|uniref:Sodium/nucleoside cotransporter n=1 Tax=Priapulus caudatus TaxID=37621 RepID=A0ABM1EY67_PRICU|nr:PREDICTED: solute carrier family 28 member 3-like isoform X2 [Priapulus caudatus]
MDSYEVDKYENPQPVWKIKHRNSILESATEEEDATVSYADDSAIGMELDELGKEPSVFVSDGEVASPRKQSLSRKTSRGPRNPSGTSLRSDHNHVYIPLPEDIEVTGESPPCDRRSPSVTFVDSGTQRESCTNKDEHDSNSKDSSLNTPKQPSKIDRYRDQVHGFFTDHKSAITVVLYALLALVYLAYFITAVVMDAGRATALLVGTVALAVLMATRLIWRKLGDTLETSISTCYTGMAKRWRWIKWVVFLGLFSAFILFLALDVAKQPRNLVSLGGFVTYVFLLFITSKHPGKVFWRPVLTGIGLQFCLGIFILRVPFGFQAFHFLGRQAEAFFKYSDYGAQFVFGEAYVAHFFAFKILPVIVYFSTVISILYYLGVMQMVIKIIAGGMRIIMGTTAAESVNTAANIFIGQTEAPLLIKPFLPNMTRSELHAVMTGGFATIAGGVLAAYIGFGVPASHLIAASVMTAPGALAVSKLFYPESEVSKMENIKDVEMPKGKERNIIEAASAGASASIKIVAHIAANLLGFLGVLYFVNAALSYFGSLVDFPELSFELLCSYIFRPFAFLMGVEWNDCALVAELLGTKTFLNEFIAYDRLGEFIINRESGTCSQDHPCMSIRSETITTYALCGFANLGSIGVTLGGLGAMAPSRKSELAGLAVRALIAGTVACFMSACIAGLLIRDIDYSLR